MKLRQTILTLFALFLFTSCLSNAEQERIRNLPRKEASEWTLFWSEEFKDQKLDETLWSRCPRSRAEWKDTMSDDPNLVKFEDGAIHLLGILNPDREKDPSKYLTAGITTKKKFSFQYGKIQIKAKFQCADGAWPALWMVGNDRGWPANGEIDLMEHLNYQKKAYQTVHSVFTVKKDLFNNPKHSGSAEIDPTAWNTYGCEWDENRIVFTINNKTNFVYPKDRSKGEIQWPFNQQFALILSMQIEGTWVNMFRATNPKDFPAEMAVDWVRIYK